MSGFDWFTKFTRFYEFTNETSPIYIYIYIGSSSNVNSSFIVNVRTAENAPHGIFSLNIHVLFRLNNIEWMLFSLNNTWIFKPNMPRDALSAVLTFTMKDEVTFEPDPIIYMCVCIGLGSEKNRNKRMKNWGTP